RSVDHPIMKSEPPPGVKRESRAPPRFRYRRQSPHGRAVPTHARRRRSVHFTGATAGACVGTTVTMCPTPPEHAAQAARGVLRAASSGPERTPAGSLAVVRGQDLVLEEDLGHGVRDVLVEADAVAHRVVL